MCEREAWKAWLLYMLHAVAQNSRLIFSKVRGIRELTQHTQQRFRGDLPELYSQRLLNNLFNHPCVGIEFIERGLGVSHPTATKYLERLA